MNSYCTILLNQATKSDILAACIQADAAVRAGVSQATAAMDAGHWTFFAGLFAVLAALAGGWFTLVAVTKQRRHELKSQVYVAAVKALATGLAVVIRMADLEIRPQDVLSVYNDNLSDLFGVHLVANLPTAAKFLACIECFGVMHKQLIKQRPFSPSGGYSLEERIAWSRRCSSVLADIVPSMTSAVAAMRAELDLPIDTQEYEALIIAVLQRTLADNERFFSELLAR